MEKIPGFMASAYNKAARMAISSYYDPLAGEIALQLKSGVALDLGTGPGYLAIEIVKKIPDIRVDGIDLTPELIKLAKENSIKAGVADRLHFGVMDAAELQFEDNSYELVFSTSTFNLL